MPYEPWCYNAYTIHWVKHCRIYYVFTNSVMIIRCSLPLWCHLISKSLKNRNHIKHGAISNSKFNVLCTMYQICIFLISMPFCSMLMENSTAFSIQSFSMIYFELKNHIITASSPTFTLYTAKSVPFKWIIFISANLSQLGGLGLLGSCGHGSGRYSRIRIKHSLWQPCRRSRH